jgi:hypothetical protein
MWSRGFHLPKRDTTAVVCRVAFDWIDTKRLELGRLNHNRRSLRDNRSAGVGLPVLVETLDPWVLEKTLRSS